MATTYLYILRTLSRQVTDCCLSKKASSLSKQFIQKKKNWCLYCINSVLIIYYPQSYVKTDMRLSCVAKIKKK